MSRFVRLLALILVTVMVAAACGDDSGGGGDSANASGDPDIEIPAPDEGEIDVDVPGISDACETAVEASIQAAQAITAGLTPGSEIADVEAFFIAAADGAPDEIRADFETIGNAIAEFVAAVEAAGADLSDPATFADPSVATALSEASQAFSGPEYTEAAESISTWTETNCDPAG